jgi:hypothetical protein
VVVDSPPGLTQGTLTQVLLQEGIVSVAMLPFTDDQAGVKGFREARTIILEQVPQERIIPVLVRTRPDILKEPGQIPELQGLEALEIPYYAELARNPVFVPNGSGGAGGLATMVGAIFGRSHSEVSVVFETLGQRLVQALAAVEV